MTDFAAFLFVVVMLLTIDKGLSRDDSDSPTKRSGMIVYTDHKTGCQYLGTILGGITPRFDRDGKPICKDAEQ